MAHAPAAQIDEFDIGRHQVAKGGMARVHHRQRQLEAAAVQVLQQGHHHPLGAAAGERGDEEQQPRPARVHAAARSRFSRSAARQAAAKAASRPLWSPMRGAAQASASDTMREA